jgi:hypothetical protein
VDEREDYADPEPPVAWDERWAPVGAVLVSLGIAALLVALAFLHTLLQFFR